MAGLYFPHDYTAAKDSKIIALRMAFGWEGYGVFWALIEMLASDSSHTLPTDYNSLAWELRFDAGKLKRLICDFGLFSLTEDGSGFYSERMSQQLQDIDELRQKRSKAGKASAAKRQRLSEQLATNVEQTEQKNGNVEDDSNTCSTHVKVLFNKENKRKENKSLNNTFDKSKDIISSERKNSEVEKLENPAVQEEFALVAEEVPVKPVEEKTEFQIPLLDGSTYFVPKADLQLYKDSFPAVNVEQELRNMRVWSDANPANRKKQKGVKRFISRWLTLKQNNSGDWRTFNAPKQNQPLPMSKQQCKPPTIDDCPF